MKEEGEERRRRQQEEGEGKMKEWVGKKQRRVIR